MLEPWGGAAAILLSVARVERDTGPLALCQGSILVCTCSRGSESHIASRFCLHQLGECGSCVLVSSRGVGLGEAVLPANRFR
eukprot:77211-Rhodomonas_salina.1